MLEYSETRETFDEVQVLSEDSVAFLSELTDNGLFRIRYPVLNSDICDEIYIAPIKPKNLFPLFIRLSKEGGMVSECEIDKNGSFPHNQGFVLGSILDDISILNAIKDNKPLTRFNLSSFESEI